MKILVVHGPNLGLLGKREPHIYGVQSLEDLNRDMRDFCQKRKHSIEIVQFDGEGDIVSLIGKTDADSIVINPGAYSHTSIAIADALIAFGKTVIEVHLSNIYKREQWRHHSYIAGVVEGQISGLGFYSYILALEYMTRKSI